MAGFVALGAAGLAKAGLDAYGAKKQREADENASVDAYNNTIEMNDLRQGAAQGLATLYNTQAAIPVGVGPDGQLQYESVTTDLGKAVQGIGTGYDNAYLTQAAGMNKALGELGAAPGLTGQAFNQYGGAAQDLSSQYLQASANLLQPQSGLTKYADQAAQGTNPYDLVGNYDQRMQNFQADPGYQFRQQQGEQAINRAASAAGGRLSGKTLQDLTSFNQGLASQEYGNVAGRNMSLLGNQASATNQANLNTQGIQANLGNLGYDAGKQLAGQAANVGGQLANMYGNYGSQMGNQVGSLAGQASATTMGGYGGLAGLETGRASQDLSTQFALAQGRFNAGSLGIPGVTPPTPQAPNVAAPYNVAGQALGDLGNAAAFWSFSQANQPDVQPAEEFSM